VFSSLPPSPPLNIPHHVPPSLDKAPQTRLSQGPQNDRAHPSRVAREIMAVGDRHYRNGRLSVNEMRTFLKGTSHEDFVIWLTGPGTRLTGNFRIFDLDCDGAIDLQELQRAVQSYYDDTEDVEPLQDGENTMEEGTPGTYLGDREASGDESETMMMETRVEEKVEVCDLEMMKGVQAEGRRAVVEEVESGVKVCAEAVVEEVEADVKVCAEGDVELETVEGDMEGDVKTEVKAEVQVHQALGEETSGEATTTNGPEAPQFDAAYYSNLEAELEAARLEAQRETLARQRAETKAKLIEEEKLFREAEAEALQAEKMLRKAERREQRKAQRAAQKLATRQKVKKQSSGCKKSPVEPGGKEWLHWVEEQKQEGQLVGPAWPSDGTARLEDALQDPLILEQEEWAEHREGCISLAMEQQAAEEEAAYQRKLEEEEFYRQQLEKEEAQRRAIYERRTGERHFSCSTPEFREGQKIEIADRTASIGHADRMMQHDAGLTGPLGTAYNAQHAHAENVAINSLPFKAANPLNSLPAPFPAANFLHPTAPATPRFYHLDGNFSGMI